MDAMHEAAISAVIEGGLSHYTAQLLEAISRTLEETQERFQEASDRSTDPLAQHRLVGAAAGVAACRLILQQAIARMTMADEANPNTPSGGGHP